MEKKLPLKYFIITFGCQMNKADSEKIAANLEWKGYKPAKNLKEANLVIINSCSVRQSAEDRVLGVINNLLKSKRKLEIVLTGCMLRYPLARLKKMLPGVNKFLKLKSLIKKENLTLRNSNTHAWIKIMEGCDNFCTYCVVPYARGKEISRPFKEIICEARQLAKRGYHHITLLGQNVNSYGKKLKINTLLKEARQLKLNCSFLKKIKTPFAFLLASLHQIKKIKKISFITSNPQDLTEDIIEVLKLPKIDKYLHLPVQSGDNQILKKMNRRYTAEQYLDLIKKIRKAIPNIEIGTDIIVGFPGETEKQFQNTVALCKKANFKVAYIAKYSPRWGTAAYKLKDNVSYAEKRRRWQILNNLINKK